MKLSRLLTIILSISFICGIGMALTAPTAIAGSGTDCDHTCWSDYNCGVPCGINLYTVTRCFPNPGIACTIPGEAYRVFHSCCVPIGCTTCVEI